MSLSTYFQSIRDILCITSNVERKLDRHNDFNWLISKTEFTWNSVYHVLMFETPIMAKQWNKAIIIMTLPYWPIHKSQVSLIPKFSHTCLKGTQSKPAHWPVTIEKVQVVQLIAHATEVLLALNLSSPGSRHVGSFSANEEQKRVGSWFLRRKCWPHLSRHRHQLPDTERGSAHGCVEHYEFQISVF